MEPTGRKKGLEEKTIGIMGMCVDYALLATL